MNETRFPAHGIPQPQADVILIRAKDVENRQQRSHFHGTILVQASATVDRTDIEWSEGIAHKHGLLIKGLNYQPPVGGFATKGRERGARREMFEEKATVRGSACDRAAYSATAATRALRALLSVT